MTPEIFNTEEMLIFSLRIALGVKFVVEEERSHCSQTRALRTFRRQAKVPLVRAKCVLPTAVLGALADEVRAGPSGHASQLV